ncbi:glycoside hydrolase [Fulvivirga sp. M361]|uniref:isoamylase early set domain-containing protein n=1 Tax=Fulvivirga sp. M361 TaxID=2594266 RepID=UPI00117B180C|nr:isoamylase early set domain-containing protein [Fulvivirga sp. M361]TRX57567.1 glycoside hydrolase [Fulvivirga sp. M361]
MAIKKQFFKTKPTAKVTLSIPKTAVKGAKKVELFGDFTGWSSGIKMTKQKDGSFKASVDLDPSGEYQFRYLIDNKRWENDWKADKYVSNGVSLEENSVIVF